MSACGTSGPGASVFSGPCAVCGANSRSRCSRCHGEMYCGPQCQRAAWPAHKAACAAAVAAARARAGAAAGASEPPGAANSGHEDAECTVCGRPASMRCGWCCTVMYCGSQCEGAARAAHKGICAAGAARTDCCDGCAGPCASCGGVATLCCGRCRRVLYCGVRCQRAASGAHAPECTSAPPIDAAVHAISGERAAALAEVKRWIADLAAKDLYQKLAACANIRKYASTSAENAAMVAALGGVPRLVSAARSDRALHGPAAATLRVLSSDYSNHPTIAIAGGIPLMIDLLCSVPSVCESATHALSNLSRNFENRATISAAGAIPLLIDVLHWTTTNNAVRRRVAETLGNLGNDAKNASIVAEFGGIESLVSMLRSSSVDVVQAAADAILLLSMHAGSRSSIVAARGIIPLVALLESDAPHTSLQVQQTAACVLKTLSENNDMNVASLVATSAIPLLMGHMTSNSVLLQVAAAATIRNVCDSANKLVSTNSPPVNTVGMLVSTTLAFRYRVESEIASGIPRLIAVLDNVLVQQRGAHSEGTQLAAVDALRRLSASSSKIRDFISSTALPLLAPLLGATSPKIRELAAATMSGLDLFQLATADALAAIPLLIGMMRSHRPHVSAITLKAIAANSAHVDAIVAAAGAQFSLLVQLSYHNELTDTGMAPFTVINEQCLAPGDAVKAARAIPVLIQLLSSPFAVVQDRAATQLHKVFVEHNVLGPAAADAVSPLIWLSAPPTASNSVQSIAATALGEISIPPFSITGARAAIPSLIAMMGSPSMHVHARAAAVLKSFQGFGALVTAIAAAADDLVLLELSLGGESTPVADAIAVMVADTFADIKDAAHALPILVQLLASPFEVVHCNAAAQLRIVLMEYVDLATAAAAGGAVPLLLKLLTSPSTRVQEIAAAALFNLKVPLSWGADAPAAIPNLMAMMQSRWISVREQAESILKRFMLNRELVRAIDRAAVAAVGDKHLEILAQLSCEQLPSDTSLVRALSTALLTKGMAIFRELLESPFGRVQVVGAVLLRRFVGIRRELIDDASNAIPALLKILNGTSPDHRIAQRAAADALATLGASKRNTEVIMAIAETDSLLALMGSQSTQTRVFAAIVLHHRIMHGENDGTAAATEASIPGFISLLPNAQVQAMCMDALFLLSVSDNAQNVIAASNGIPALIAVLTSGTPKSQGRAALLLARLSEIEGCADQIAAASGIPPLIMLMSSADAHLRDITAYMW